MAEYYDALTFAVAKFEFGDRSARYAFYDRARQLVLKRLRSIDPPISEADLQAELSAIEIAIEQVEKDIRRSQDSVARNNQIQLAIPPEHFARTANEDDAALPRKQSDFSRGFGILVGAVVLLVIAAGGTAYWVRQRESPVQGRDLQSVVAANRNAERANNLDQTIVSVENLPYIVRRQLVYFRTTYPAGTIVIAKSQHFLYVVKPNSAALRYTIGIGPDCSESIGLYRVSRKTSEPETTPESGAQGRRPTPVRFDSRGDARTLYLSESEYRIREADTPNAIGQRLPSPGFQLVTDDIVDLYDRTELGTRVVVMN